jgi:hypothetical protein
MNRVLELVPFVAIYVLILGNLGLVGGLMVHTLGQTGGFPSSAAELREMSERIDQKDAAVRYKKYRRRSAILWASCISAIILSSILNAWLKG